MNIGTAGKIMTGDITKTTTNSLLNVKNITTETDT